MGASCGTDRPRLPARARGHIRAVPLAMRHVLKVPLLAIFVAVMTASIIGAGYLFNAVIWVSLRYFF